MANSTVNPYGPARGATRQTYSGGTDTPAGVFNAGEVLTAQAVAPFAAITALGNSWHCQIATGSAFTHVAAWPTTRAELVLFNSASAGSNLALVIESVWAANVATSVAAATNYTLLAQIVQSSATAITDDTAQLITSLSGKGTSYTGYVKRAVANTAYAVANRWMVLGGSTGGGATATIGLAAFAPVKGGIIIPPQAFLCLNLVVGTATGTASIGVAWDEMVLPLG